MIKSGACTQCNRHHGVCRQRTCIHNAFRPLDFHVLSLRKGLQEAKTELFLLFHPPLQKQTNRKEGIEKYKQMDILSGNPALIFQYHHNITLLVHHFRIYKALSFKLQSHKASKEKIFVCILQVGKFSPQSYKWGQRVRTKAWILQEMWCVHVCLSRPVVSNSLGSFMQPTRLLCPWDFPVKSPGVGCHFLLQGTFLTQGLKLGLLHWRQILYH